MTARAAVLTAESEDSYQTLLEKDRFCESARHPVDQGQNRQAFLRSLGLEMDARFREMTEANNPYFSDTEATFTSPLARFIQALRLGGLLRGIDSARAPNLTAAWEILAQLHREDPSNAAYPLFRMVIERELERPPEAVRASAQEILRATHVNSLFTDFMREVFVRMQENASKFVAGVVFLTKLPLPDYSSVSHLIMDLDREVPGLSSAVGQMMVEPGLRATESSRLWDYNALEYSLGRMVAPELDVPRFTDLDNQKSSGPLRWEQTILDENWKQCDLQTREKYSLRVQDWLPL